MCCKIEKMMYGLLKKLLCKIDKLLFGDSKCILYYYYYYYYWSIAKTFIVAVRILQVFKQKILNICKLSTHFFKKK